MKKRRYTPRDIGIMAVFVSLGIILQYVERFIMITPVPGGKLGLSNIVSILNIFLFGGQNALTVSLIRAFLGTVLTSGDGDDYGKIIITAPGKPLVDIEVISADAFASDFVFKIFGTKGTLMSTNSSYKLKYVEDFSAYPSRPVIRESLSDENGNPVYCSEKLEFVEESDKIVGSSFDVAVKDFYKMMYDAIFNGTELDIKPEYAAKVIELIEACHAQNPLPVKYE